MVTTGTSLVVVDRNYDQLLSLLQKCSLLFPRGYTDGVEALATPASSPTLHVPNDVNEYFSHNISQILALAGAKEPTTRLCTYNQSMQPRTRVTSDVAAFGSLPAQSIVYLVSVRANISFTLSTHEHAS